MNPVTYFAHGLVDLSPVGRDFLRSNDDLQNFRDPDWVRLQRCLEAALVDGPESPWLSPTNEQDISFFAKNSPYRAWVHTPALRRATGSMLHFRAWGEALRCRDASCLEQNMLKDVSDEYE